jgi:hypothetical protein
VFKQTFLLVLVIQALTVACRDSDTPPHTAKTSAVRAPDIVGIVTIMNTSPDNRLMWVEADPRDPTVIGHSAKAEISNFYQLRQAANIKLGCVVRVWYDPAFPVLDRYPEIAVAESMEVVRCPHAKSSPGLSNTP